MDSTEEADVARAGPSARCKFVRTLARQRLQYQAAAKYREYCGWHRTRPLKNQSKGCIAINRAGKPCKAEVHGDQLCPKHWEKLLGHEYVRDGDGFQCHLCGELFGFWQVLGQGSERTGSVKHISKCPTKMTAPPLMPNMEARCLECRTRMAKSKREPGPFAKQSGPSWRFGLAGRN